MRTLIEEWEHAVVRIVKDLHGVDVSSWRPLIDHAADRKFGDFTSNVALRLARELKRPPREIAQALAEKLQGQLPSVERISVAGGGFVNLHAAPAYFADVIDGVLKQGETWGSSSVGAGRRVRVEFVSANPTGPLTVAHGRQAAVGDTLVRLLRFAGYDAVPEYFWNDSGNQMNKLWQSIFSRYGDLRGKPHPFPEDGYHGDYILEIAKAIARNPPPEESVRSVGIIGMNMIRDGILQDLRDFRVAFDTHTSQQTDIEDRGLVGTIVDEFTRRGLTYEKEGALWFRSKDFGDAEDRVLRKSDGNYTYRTPDIAFHREKFKTCDTVIDLWGPDHHAHVSCMASALKALGIDREFRVIIVQFCSLYRGREKLKMSTRAGEFVTLRQVMDEVGVDATRYFFVMRKTDAHLDFDLDVAKAQSADNPAYYIQYAHARVCSIFRKGIEGGLIKADEIVNDVFIGGANLALMREGEHALAAALDRFPAVVAGAATAREPHRIANYAHELAGIFQNWYQQGDKDHALRALCDDPALCRMRLAVISAVRITLKNALSLLGVSAPGRM